MLRKALGVIVGILATIILTYLLPQTFGSGVVRYTSLLFGSGVAGFICKDKGWLFGGIVGLVVSAIVTAILVDIAGESWGRLALSPPQMRLLWLNVTSIITGSLGGLAGQHLQRRFIGAADSAQP
jgi:hypothetical protein